MAIGQIEHTPPKDVNSGEHFLSSGTEPVRFKFHVLCLISWFSFMELILNLSTAARFPVLIWGREKQLQYKLHGFDETLWTACTCRALLTQERHFTIK